MGIFDTDFALLDTRRLYLPTLSETFAVVKDFAITEIFTLIGIMLWLIILALSLRGVDRRDGITGMTYVLFMVAAGATLVFAATDRITGGQADRSFQSVVIIAFGAVAGFRWAFRRTPPAKEVHRE